MTIIDLSIIAIYITIIFGVGIYSKSKVENFSSFMIADHKVPLSLGVVSMLGTELGLITLMYNAQTGINDQFASFHIGVIAFFATLFIGLTGVVVVRLRELGLKSIPEYYNYRFGKKTRVLGAIMLATGGILNMGLFLKIGAIFVQGIFGFDDDAWILPIIMIVLLVLVLTYTMLGGMISVIITDYIQFVVLSLGLIIATIYSIYYLGWNTIFTHIELITLKSPIEIYSPFESRGGLYVSWQLILGFVSAVIWPTAITRALAMDSPKSVKKQYQWSSFSFMIRFIVPSFLGICALVYYNGSVGNPLMLMPQYLSEILPIGILGLVTAAMLSAFMSTHDSYLLCWSTIITNDIIDPLSENKLSSSNKIKISRYIIVILGLYILYWGLFYEGTDAIWDYLGITGAIYFSGSISVLLFGLYWKSASSTGAILSLLGGFTALAGLEPIRKLLGIGEYGPEIIGLFSIAITMFLMVVGSLVFPDKERTLI